MRTTPLVLIFALACGGASTPVETPETPTRYEVPASPDLQTVLAAPWRDGDRARDGQRHPAETLAFFGLEPDMTVVECWAGGGWYTRILAPYLRDRGKLISGGLDPEDERRGQYERNFRAMLERHPELYDQVEVRTLHPGNFLDGVPDESVDLVLTFRSVHNWIRSEGHDPNDYFGAAARVLKPGGVLGVVQHRAHEDMEEARTGTTGYVAESYVIELAERAGLVLDDRSEVNANPRDTHMHEGGVWSLNPVGRGGAYTAQERDALGESDRMTLRFRKPEALPAAEAAPAPARSRSAAMPDEEEQGDAAP